MGFNTTMIVLNDGLGEIAEDKDFGKKVAAAILGLSGGKRIDIPSGNHANAASVIETHHAGGVAVVAVGGNHATVIDHTGDVPHHTEQGQVAILESLAAKLGFKLVRAKK